MACRSSLMCAAAIVTAVLLVNPNSVFAEGEFSPSFRPELEVPRLSEAIKIDGELDDPGWRKAARATGFAETSPGDQVAPPVRSEALIAYNATYLYVALIAYDSPDAVRVSWRDRDEIFRDDYFGVMLDTYGDASWGYELFVNPLGIQGDLRMLSNGSEEIAFDIVWESEGKVTDSGYQVELAIPFSSLRFPDKPEQTWRANFWRDHQREIRRRYAWAAQDRDEPCFICQWGTLTGIRDIKPGKNLEVMPNVIGYQSGAINDVRDPNSGFENSDFDGEASVNIRYGLSSNSSLEVTVNPDFSQVESDAAQIDVNTTFALFYSERRPFFQEGGNLFSTPFDVVYTRSINNPKVAAKYTGQFGRSSVAYVFARDETSPMVVPLAQRSVVAQNGAGTVNILRARQTFGEDSYVGLVATNRMMEGGGSGTATGVDGRVRLRKNWRLHFQTLASYTDEFDDTDFIDTTMADGVGQALFDRGRHTVTFDGENYWGQAVYAGLVREARTWIMTLDYTETSPAFRTDNGFTGRNDQRSLNLWTGLVLRPNTEWLIHWQPSIEVGRVWDWEAAPNPFRFDDGARDEWIRTTLYFCLKGQTDVTLQYLNSRERFSGFLFEGISRGTMSVNSNFSEAISGGFQINHGKTIWRRHYREYDEVGEEDDTTHVVNVPDLGRGTDLSIWASVKPTRRLFVQPEFSHSRLSHSDSYMAGHPDEEREIFKGYILRVRSTYQFSREWFLRLIIQYNDFDNSLDIEPLLTYKINPFTIFYVGATSNYRYYDADIHETLTSSEWETTSRQFFFKMQYLFRI
ncbi:MAG: carbohydrate binding family 9 domain-containing protein [candidate division Zixibacteria bacterium]|nr:carbohydrate binding family 9 domain-containing protein [candidate division Zixibacteria bacterium]